MLALCLLLVPAAAFGFSVLQEKKYTASASLLFRDPALDQKLFGSTFLQPGGDPAREAATNIKLVSLDAVADRTSRALHRDLTPEQVTAAVDVSAEGQSDVVSVDATDPSPQFAARLANVFASQYIAFRREADRAKIQEAQQLVQRQLSRLSEVERQGPRGRSLAERAEQLQILGSLQTGNAELVQHARTPTHPSEPKTIRNTVLGVFVGLILGIALCLLLERLDRRLREPKDIEDIVERPILAIVPESRTLAQSGPARERSLPMNEEEAFRMLRANLRYFNVDHPIKSVLVTSPAPGDGKSTVAWNLAFAAASAGERVLLIEADLRHPSLAASNEHLRGAPGLSAVLAGQISVDEAVRNLELAAPNGGASKRGMSVLVAGPLPPNPAELIDSDRMRQLIHEAGAKYELIVIDTPPAAVVSDAIPLLKEVSGVIVVARLGKSTRDAVSHLRRQLDNLQAPTLGVVVNAFKAGRRMDAYGYGYGYGPGPERETAALNGGQSAPTPVGRS